MLRQEVTDRPDPKADYPNAGGGPTVVRVTNFMEPESENPEPLRKVMREWRVTDPLPPRFQEGVWRRIHQAESSATPAAASTLWSVFMAWLTKALPRPAVAVAYVSILLVSGMTTGYWQAWQTTSRLDDQLGTRYVQAVDPYQKPRL